MRWAAFYEGGLMLTGEPWDLPERGIVAIAQEGEDGNVEVLTGDFFAFHGGRWWNHDLDSLLDRLHEDARSIEAVRRGRYVPTLEFQAIFHRAHAWRPM